MTYFPCLCLDYFPHCYFIGFQLQHPPLLIYLFFYFRNIIATFVFALFADVSALKTDFRQKHELSTFDNNNNIMDEFI